MTKYSHEPDDYKCPFCAIVAGKIVPYAWTMPEEVVLREKNVTCWISMKWWKHNPGHVIVVPNKHIENMYTLPKTTAGEIHEVAKRVALAMKDAYGCDGVSTRQHNEPHGDQDVWHYHLHVFPRFENDRLYERHREMWFPSVAERVTYAERLRTALGIEGVPAVLSAKEKTTKRASKQESDAVEMNAESPEKDA
ncbi:MAG: HIT family protein [Chloroflexota bacterium]